MIGRRVSLFARAATRSIAAPVVRTSVVASSVTASRLYSTLGDLVASHAEAHPRREVVKVPFQDLSWDSTELKTQTDALACGLVELGYTSESKLAVWLANEVEHLCAVLAAAKIGCQLVVLDPHLSVDAVESVLKAEGCRGLMFGPRFKSQARSKDVQQLTDLGLWHWGDLVNEKSMRNLRHLINIGHEEIGGIMQYKHFPVYDPMPNPLPALSGAVSSDDVLIIPYTAAEDGSAVQGAPLTQADLLATAKASAASMELGRDDVVCVSAYQSSRFGLAAGSLAALHAGSKLVIPSREEDAVAALACVQEHGATAVVASARSFSDVSCFTDYNVESLRTGIIAGAGAPPALTGSTAVDGDAVQAGSALV